MTTRNISANEKKAHQISMSAGHNNPAFFTGVMMGIEKSKDTPASLRKIAPDFYPAEYWNEMEMGFRFYNNIASIVSQ